MAERKQLQPVPLSAMPKEQASHGTNLADIRARVTNAKWLSEDGDVVLYLGDFRLSVRCLGHGGVLFILAAMLCGRVIECVEN
jgi:hypothetical protein